MNLKLVGGTAAALTFGLVLMAMVAMGVDVMTMLIAGGALIGGAGIAAAVMANLYGEFKKIGKTEANQAAEKTIKAAEEARDKAVQEQNELLQRIDALVRLCWSQLPINRFRPATMDHLQGKEDVATLHAAIAEIQRAERELLEQVAQALGIPTAGLDRHQLRAQLVPALHTQRITFTENLQLEAKLAELRQTLDEMDGKLVDAIMARGALLNEIANVKASASTAAQRTVITALEGTLERLGTTLDLAVSTRGGGNGGANRPAGQNAQQGGNRNQRQQPPPQVPAPQAPAAGQNGNP